MSHKEIKLEMSCHFDGKLRFKSNVYKMFRVDRWMQSKYFKEKIFSNCLTLNFPKAQKDRTFPVD